MTDAQTPLADRSPMDVARLYGQMAARMHRLNRVAKGERRFAWHMAEARGNPAQAFEARLKDPRAARAFGDGWTKGTLTEAERQSFLAQLKVTDPKAPVPTGDVSGRTAS